MRSRLGREVAGGALLVKAFVENGMARLLDSDL